MRCPFCNNNLVFLTVEIQDLYYDTSGCFEYKCPVCDTEVTHTARTNKEIGKLLQQEEELKKVFKPKTAIELNRITTKIKINNIEGMKCTEEFKEILKLAEVAAENGEFSTLVSYPYNTPEEQKFISTLKKALESLGFKITLQHYIIPEGHANYQRDIGVEVRWGE